MPILGVIASAITGNLNVNSYESIMTATVSTAVGYVEFTSIPATYTHLQIRAIADTTAGDVSIFARFNGDTGSNYSWHTLYTDGGGSAYSDYNGVSSTSYTSFSRGGNGSGVFSASVIDILDYKDTNKYKTLRSFTGKDNNGSGIIWLSSGSWRNTNAITSITITPDSGNLKTYTQFALYGIKGS